MDPLSFDALTRTLAAGRSRRHALRALVGGVAATLLAARRPEAAPAAPLCSPRCNALECETCDPEVRACVYRCRDSQVCRAGSCVAAPPRVCDPACPPTHACQNGVCVEVCTPPCTRPLVCQNGHCVCPGPICGIPGHGGYGCCPGGFCNGDACCHVLDDDTMECAIP
jgi:hypothetical protein